MNMNISTLQQLYQNHPAMDEMCHFIAEKKYRTLFLEGLQASATSLFFSAVQCKQPAPFLFVLPTSDDAAYFYHDLVQINGDKNVLFFPSSYRRSIRYGQKDSGNEILRTEVLSHIQQKNKLLSLVTYPEALAEKVISQQQLSSKTLALAVGAAFSIKTVVEKLYEFDFERVDYVYEPGQYAVRGSLIDVYSYSNEYPYRIDFFGDEIDSIRLFEVNTQLTKEKVNELSIVPQLENADDSSVSFLSFLPANVIVVMDNLTELCDTIGQIHENTFSQQAILAHDSEQKEDTAALSLPVLTDKETFIREILPFKRIEKHSALPTTANLTLSFQTASQPIFHKNFDLVSQSFSDYREKGYTLYILSDSAKQMDRIATIFQDRGDKIPFLAIDKTIHEGFVDHTLRCCCFTDHQLFDRFHKYSLKSDRVRGGKMALTLKELREFQLGDYVVHLDHGVGKFGGLVRLPTPTAAQEVIKLIFQNEDVVFVNIHSLHKISKYKGKDGQPPRLNKLGTGAWQRLKETTKKKIKDIARDLIELYANRQKERGYAYSKDSFLQQELEASFIYEDTPDQLKATQDVKSDMESELPMDRLICGDVGFGKTEIAIRAAFKAVTDNKQVAILVPTTVLAYQHYKTLSARLAEFPCRIDYLSRARKPSDVKKIITDLKTGDIQIIIGTHRIIGKDVHFKDIGLLIIDEEQKFGVSVKEKLKQLKINVDTLTMTATPIPRTLQFSLMGARDLSVIQTPPPNRYPIQTELHIFNKEVIREAINFEISRNGQVFFVNNRIQNIYELADMIHELVPDARVVVGHGQMEPAKLEQVILDMVNYDYDVLIATSIIESGIDIPNVNTIIINQAQNFGLSDLHQLRGRVGRGNKKAFCYLLAPPLSLLTNEAKRRLQAIENFSELGSGIHIAMQDLDIRGAGNMLGAEQSGFIADLGYETYQKILNEAVDELKIDEFATLYAEKEGTDGTTNFVKECLVESDMELLFPHDYIPSSSERMLLYRELDNMETDKEVLEFKERLQDRFGAVPKEGLELLRVVQLRRLGKLLGVERIYLKANRMSLFLVKDMESAYYTGPQFGKLLAYMGRYTRNCNLREKNHQANMLIKEVKSVEMAVLILQEMEAIGNNEGDQ